MNILWGSLLVENVVTGWFILRFLLFLLFFLAEVVTKVIIHKQPIIFILFVIWWRQSNHVIFVWLILLRYVVPSLFHPECVLLGEFLGRALIPRVVLIIVLVLFVWRLLVQSRRLQYCCRCGFRLSSGCCCICFIILYEFLLLFPILFVAREQTWMKLLYQLRDL